MWKWGCCWQWLCSFLILTMFYFHRAADFLLPLCSKPLHSVPPGAGRRLPPLASSAMAGRVMVDSVDFGMSRIQKKVLDSASRGDKRMMGAGLVGRLLRPSIRSLAFTKDVNRQIDEMDDHRSSVVSSFYIHLSGHTWFISVTSPVCSLVFIFPLWFCWEASLLGVFYCTSGWKSSGASLATDRFFSQFSNAALGIIRFCVPVSSLSFMSDFFEKVVLQQLVDCLDPNKSLCTSQSAYRPHHSTETFLLKTSNYILLGLDKWHVSINTAWPVLSIWHNWS